MSRLGLLVLLLKSRRPSLALKTIRRRLYSDHVSLGLRRDTTLPFRVPRSPLPLTVRPIEPNDVALFVDVTGPEVNEGSIMDRVQAACLMESGVRTCYVAVTRGGHVCYMQFLIDPSQNETIRKVYGDLVPPLEADEALLEAAFSLERYRGRGVMLHAMPELAKRARALNLRWLITFVPVTNLPMLKGCQWTGFLPYVERRQSYRLFRRKVTFTPLPGGTPYPFDTHAEEGVPGTATAVAGDSTTVG
jgi:hypothetical protein